MATSTSTGPIAADLPLPTPLQFERAGLSCWPGLRVEWDGQWVRRSANGLTKRANSAQCFDPADDSDVGRRVDAVDAWFRRQGLPPVFRLNLLTGPNLLAELDRRGWASIDHSHLFAMRLGAVVADPRGEVVPVLSPTFLTAQQRLKAYSDDELARFAAILGALEGPAAGIVLRAPDGRVVSSALMALSGGIVITGSVVTDPSERRKGYADAMMRTGLAWAAREGAAFAALNVEAGNLGAQALYGRLGYARVYDYVYRIPPGTHL